MLSGDLKIGVYKKRVMITTTEVSSDSPTKVREEVRGTDRQVNTGERACGRMKVGRGVSVQ